MAKSRPRRKQSSPRSEHVYYILKILSWQWSLSFGVAHDPRQTDPYDDYRHLTIHSQFLWPDKLRDATIDLTFIPDRDLDQEQRRTHRPPHIGFINLRKAAHGILSLPSDALPALLPMLIGDKFGYLVLHGTGLRYRQASVHSFRFEMQINEDDWPLAD